MTRPQLVNDPFEGYRRSNLDAGYVSSLPRSGRFSLPYEVSLTSADIVRMPGTVRRDRISNPKCSARANLTENQ